jgi:DNA-binding NtrC family response regulator
MVDRSPFEAAEAIVRAVTCHCPRFESEEAVWEAFISRNAPGEKRYFEVLRRTRHSIFYSQLQRLYSFARESCPDTPEEVCFAAGRIYADAWCERNMHAILRTAFAHEAEFQSTMVGVFRDALYQATGAKYTLRNEILADEILLRLEHRWPDVMQEFFEAHLLEPEEAFRNAFQFIAGAFTQFAARTTAGFDGARVRCEVAGTTGALRLPISDKDGFPYASLVPTLLDIIQRIESRRRDSADLDRQESDLIIGSTAMRRTWELIRRASRTDDTVLLRGESGTGKTFVARKIHGFSERRDLAFIEVGVTADVGSDNMVQSDLFGHEKGAFTGATSRKNGLFSLADGGTIFLDEIGDASAEMQAKLLRVLEDGAFKRLGGTHDLQVNVRVIAATNRNLERMVEERSFRRDLYYRLNVIPIELPPLRERPEDIGPLAEFLLARAATQRNQAPKTLTPGLLARLERHSWPGNVRELDNALRSASALSDGPEITEEALLASMGKLTEAGEPLLPPETPASRTPRAPIDEQALREAIRAGDSAASAAYAATHENPAHIEYAKRVYLTALIDVYGGDLAAIGRHWDRSSEKTIRTLVRAYGLTERLAAARARRREELR